MEDKNNDQDESRAAIVLWNAACQAVAALEDMAKNRPELLRPIARQLFFWPGFISRKRRFDTENAELMDKIELGVGGPYSTKQWRLSAPSTRFAMFLHLLCRTYEKQWQLPPLTKETKRLWFEQGWKHMVNDLHIVPEDDPHLGPLGESAKRYYYKREDPKERMPLAVRAEIERQLWKAFDTLIFPSK